MQNLVIIFNTKWTYHVLQLKWTKLINSDETINWFIDNKAKYGNTKYILKLGAILCTIGCIINLFVIPVLLVTNLSILGLIIVFFLILISLFSAISFYVIIVCKTSKFNDTFHIPY